MFLVVASLHFGAKSSHIQHILEVTALAAPRGRHGFGVFYPSRRLPRSTDRMGMGGEMTMRTLVLGVHFHY